MGFWSKFFRKKQEVIEASEGPEFEDFVDLTQPPPRNLKIHKLEKEQPEIKKDMEIKKNLSWLYDYVAQQNYATLGYEDAQKSTDSEDKARGIKALVNELKFQIRSVEDYYKGKLGLQKRRIIEFKTNSMLDSAERNEVVLKELEDKLEELKNIKKDIDQEQGDIYSKVKHEYTKGFNQAIENKNT